MPGLSDQTRHLSFLEDGQADARPNLLVAFASRYQRPDSTQQQGNTGWFGHLFWRWRRRGGGGGSVSNEGVRSKKWVP